MTNVLRDHAESMIDAYRQASEWSVARQVVLQCLTATWAQASTPQRFFALAGPLCGQPVPITEIGIQLGKMRRAGLLRKRMIAGAMHYELNLPV